MIYRAAWFLSEKISKIIDDEVNIEIYCYGLEIILNSLISILSVLIIGIIIDRPFCTILYLISYSVPRLWAGGYHAKTHFRCICFFIIFYLLSLLLIKNGYIPRNGIIYLLLIDNLLIYRLAPVGGAENPIPRKKEYEMKRKATIISITISCMIYVISFSSLELAMYGGMGITWMIVLLAIGKIQFFLWRRKMKKRANMKVIFIGNIVF